MVSISAVASMIAIETKLLCSSQVTSAWVLSADLIKPPPPRLSSRHGFPPNSFHRRRCSLCVFHGVTEQGEVEWSGGRFVLVFE